MFLHNLQVPCSHPAVHTDSRDLSWWLDQPQVVSPESLSPAVLVQSNFKLCRLTGELGQEYESALCVDRLVCSPQC